MAYTIKQYDKGFKILGKYEGWHYGIWEDSMPPAFVFLKPINNEDFVFFYVSSTNLFCGILQTYWMRCVDGEIAEISEDEAQMLLDTKLNRYDYIPDIKSGDIICVLNHITNEFEEYKAIELYFQKDGMYIRYESNYGDDYEKADNYNKTWYLRKDDSDNEKP